MLIRNWKVVLASIAGISLLVGGIGIFSVMQISISERVYEIGLRKSIGATDGEILGQFLVESVSLSLVGGLLGSALGFGVTVLAGQAFEDGLAVSPAGLALAAGFAMVIGLTAGIWPALRASRFAPVDALRGLCSLPPQLGPQDDLELGGEGGALLSRRMPVTAGSRLVTCRDVDDATVVRSALRRGRWSAKALSSASSRRRR